MPYQQGVLESDPDLDDDQLMIVYLDCYPVHAGEGFRFWVYEKFPFIILCFVPANCKQTQISMNFSHLFTQVPEKHNQQMWGSTVSSSTGSNNHKCSS